MNFFNTKPYPQISISLKYKLNFGIALSDGVIPEYIENEQALERFMEDQFKNSLFEYLKRENLLYITGVKGYFTN